jgi:hypothetical protein
MTRSTGTLACFVALLLAACATRTVPTPASPGSPLTPAHPEGAAPRVTLALDEDPPLPGESTAGWIGLEAPTSPDGDAGAPADPHQHHHPAPIPDGATHAR